MPTIRHSGGCEPSQRVAWLPPMGYLRRQQHHAAHRWEIERELAPGVAIIDAVPDLAVAEPGIDLARHARIGQQRVGHGDERFGQPAGELLPGRATGSAEDGGLSLACAVRLPRTRRYRGIPDLRMCTVRGYCPAIVPVEPSAGLLPGHAGITADSDARTRTAALIDPSAVGGVVRQRVAVAQRPAPVPAPCLPTITAATDRTAPYSRDDHTCIIWREGERLHVGGERCLGGREPKPARAKPPKTLQPFP